jgi:arsenate reductase
VALLEERTVDVDVIEYLSSPLDRSQLLEILGMLDVEPAELVRKDRRFDELQLDAANYVTADAVTDLLVAHPELMQRPIAVRDGRAVIGRPSELVLELLD